MEGHQIVTFVASKPYYNHMLKCIRKMDCSNQGEYLSLVRTRESLMSRESDCSVIERSARLGYAKQRGHTTR